MASVPNWKSEGIKASPGAGVLLADSGQLPTGTHRFNVCVASTVGFAAKYRWMEATNTTAIIERIIPITANNLFCEYELNMSVQEDNERLTVVTNGAVVGNCQATITEVV